MKVIVPLAGPDFIRADGSLKAHTIICGEPLLPYVLARRPWAKVCSPTDYSFVLIDRPETRHFAETSLAEWYPSASVTFMSDYTRGAALSSLAGMASVISFDTPVIVDLADILYTCKDGLLDIFDTNPDCGGIALTFKSDNPAYSYLSTDSSGIFVEAAEKRVISKNASAGTYLFSKLPVFLRALAFGLENPKTHTFRDLFFVCPLYNGVRDQGKTVRLEPVTDVIDIKMESDRA